MNLAPANSISTKLIPNVLKGLVDKTKCNDPSKDAFDLNDLIGSLTGGNTATAESGSGGFYFQNLLDKLTIGDENSENGGGFNFQDIISQVTQGAQKTRNSNQKVVKELLT